MVSVRPRLGRGFAAALLAALAVTGCGEGDEPRAKAKPVGEVLAGSVAPLAQCRDWNAGTREERLATIEDIREQVNLQDSAVKTPELSDKAAYRILNTTCHRDFAGSFRLYKLYARATSFAPYTQ
jgi:hypothetical protein